MIAPSWLWIAFTVAGAAAQTARTAMQRELTDTLGTVGATHVRFLFGLPFALLFLAVTAFGLPDPLPAPNGVALAWITLGALSQIIATALMLAAMRERSFVVATALLKIEPVWVALMGVLLLGEHLSSLMLAAIATATLGVLLISWPRPSHGGRAPSLQSALLGLGSGALFGLAAIGYRGGILALGAPSFVSGATTALALALLLQTVLLTSYLALFDRPVLTAILKAWRPSLFAGLMGALASQLWFLAFALQSAALVRTVALVEILFALAVSRGLLRQRVGRREMAGILLLILGVAVLLNAE